MNRLSAKLGYWSAISTLILSMCYGIGVVLSIIFPIPAWTNLADFIDKVQPVSLVVYTFIQITGFFLGPVELLLLCGFHEYASNDKKILTRIGLCCIIATMVLGNQLYFTQFNAMRLIISKEVVTGLEQFVQWNPHSFIMVSGSLGWTFFAGLAFIFVAPIFSGGQLERRLRYSSLILGSCSIVGSVGVVFGNMVCLAIYFIGAMVAGTTLSILAIIFFRRLDKAAASNFP